MAISNEQLHLRLYIAGSAPNSMRALANLSVICQGIPLEQVNLEVIDVLQEPLRALHDKVFVTPVLHKIAPPPTMQIVGDLGDHARVRLALGLGEVER
ncbi:MAG TPA: circadian clock KaiB family protein [Armatimonadota bacterium]|nr:circadian clock KaiB family protein [Armatimonadota bacterium]